MSSVKVLITGGSGLLGQYLNLELNQNYSITTLYHSEQRNCIEFSNSKLNLENESEIIGLFKKVKPNIVIHAGGVSNSNLADKLGTDITYKVNVSATKLIAKLCSDLSAKLIYISTDLVYDGNQGQYLSEDSKLNPISLYAESKLKAENEIKKISSNFLILRMALMFGQGLNSSKNFYSQMIDSLSKGKGVNLFTDQYRTPLELSDSARMISELLSINIKNEIINFGGSKRISRFEMGEIVCDKYGFDKSLLIKTQMSEIQDYLAVKDVSMNTDKLKSIGILSNSLINGL